MQYFRILLIYTYECKKLFVHSSPYFVTQT